MLNRIALESVECFLGDELRELWLDREARFEMPMRFGWERMAVTCPVSVGAFCTIKGALTHEIASIGRYCTIAAGVHWTPFIYATDRITMHAMTFHHNIFGHGPDPAPLPERRYTVVENDVHIGELARIMGGVRLGTGCVVACEAVVTKDVPPYAIVGGNPAKIIRYRFEPAMIERLLASEWWRYDLRDIPFPLGDVMECLEYIESGALAPYVGPVMTGAEITAIGHQPRLQAAE